MQRLRHVAQQARFPAMQPRQVTQNYRERDLDLQAFDAAVAWAGKARRYRTAKRERLSCHSAGSLEAMAREAEAYVREIALQSEIILQRRAEAAEADRAMLGIMLGGGIVIRAIRNWWRLLGCDGSTIEIARESDVAKRLAAARGVDVSALQSAELAIFSCSQMYDRCAACPRFHAHRHLFSVGRMWPSNLKVLASRAVVKPNLNDSHRESAEIDNAQHDALVASGVNARPGSETKPHAIGAQHAPGVDNPQHCTEHCHRQRDCLNRQVAHADILHQRGVALPGLTAWLAGITIALLIACSHYLDDIPDHGAEWDQAVYLQDAINAAIQQEKFAVAAQALCGPQASWQQLHDGSVQCRTKHGKPTITVQVSP